MRRHARSVSATLIVAVQRTRSSDDRDSIADDDRAECRTDDQTDASAFADSDACADEVH